MITVAAGALLAALPVHGSLSGIVQTAHAAQAQDDPDDASDEFEPDDAGAKDKKAPADSKKNDQNDDDAMPPDDKAGSDDNDDAMPPDDSKDSDAPADNADTQPDDNAQQSDNEAVEPLNPGEAVVTRFSHEIDGQDGKGKSIKVINLDGVSASILDIRNPGQPPFGQHWINEPQRMFVTARDVGQVFGVAIARTDDQGPDIFLSATAAYGLHRSGDDKNADWMEGQWGRDAGPGTIYRLNAENGYKPEKFADVKLDGRDNSGASLGNIAYDKTHNRLFVSDLETGMIHSFDVQTGQDMGHFDHGLDGRSAFTDVWSGQQMALEPVAFDPKSAAQVDDCSGDFDKTPACWNIADFRRRVWGLKVRTDEGGGTRLYYSIWGSDAFGNPDWAKSGDDRRNAVWSVGITDDGSFDKSSVRREFFMPAFWPSDPSLGEKAGNSNAPSDITLPECIKQNVMLVAERGGMRNLGLDKLEPFSRPYESRVVRYELGDDNIWRPTGRYDVGFHDRGKKEGDPLLFANAAGGMDFNYRISENGSLDLSAPSQSVWMTGDGLCSPLGGCNDTEKGAGSDTSEVHGLQGTPADAFVPVEPSDKPSTDALMHSFMIDTDINVDGSGQPIDEEMSRNDATKIGDVAIYQVCQAVEPLPVIHAPGEQRTETEDDYTVSDEPPLREPPVHTLNKSHMKWASSGHRVDASWHWRRGSWHQADRSWHFRNGSWHDRVKSWHWRDGSWHESDRSWHRRDGSWHDRERSWHFKSRSFHARDRSWDDHPDHDKRRSLHFRDRSWEDPDHDKRRSSHMKDQSFRDDTPDHDKRRSSHDDDTPGHDRPQHIKGRTWAGDQTPQHNKKLSFSTDNSDPTHLKDASRSDNTPDHSKRQSRMDQNDRPTHSKRQSRADSDTHDDSDKPHHSRRSSYMDQNKDQSTDDNSQPKHSKRESRASTDDHDDSDKPHHSRRSSYMDQNKDQSTDDNSQPKHSKRESRASSDNHDDNDKPRHSRRSSYMDQNKDQSTDDNSQPKHSKRESRASTDDHDDSDKPRHSRRSSFMEQNKDQSTDDNSQPSHSRRSSFMDQNKDQSTDDNSQPKHSKRESRASNDSHDNDNSEPRHSRRSSFGMQDNRQPHSDDQSTGDDSNNAPHHGRRKSLFEPQ